MGVISIEAVNFATIVIYSRNHSTNELHLTTRCLHSSRLFISNQRRRVRLEYDDDESESEE